MKANELMIGDWVYLIHTEDNIAPYKEETRIEADDLSRDACILEAHYEPIPLTPEILEKNGFVENRGVTSWKFETEKEDLIDIYGYNEYHLSINIEDTHGSGKGYRWMLNNLVIFYVHQLQHAIRLCGIEKEITL